MGDLVCKLTVFLSECCTFCTILHITFLSLERYLAVCWPITAKTLVTRHRTRVLIGCLWLGAAVSAAPVLVMVGVEEVRGEEVAYRGWREDMGWADREAVRSEFLIGDRGNGHLAVSDHLLGTTWGESDQTEWSDSVEKRRPYHDGVKSDDGVEKSVERQNKMKEDEGGGREVVVDDTHIKDTDNSECRCTQYAASSGLLSAMMILSNLYFLVPFCILGLVYTLIGRTLWLRPRSGRRDQSHKNTVKMLGMNTEHICNIFNIIVCSILSPNCQILLKLRLKTCSLYCDLEPAKCYVCI